MLSIIDRYVARKFIGFFIAGLTVFVTIFLAVDFMGSFARYDTSTLALLRYYIFFLPEIAYQMFPVACLLATVFTLSSLNKSNELIALFSVGLSLGRVSVPILALVGLFSSVTFWLGDHLLPKFAQKKNYVYYVDIRKRPGLYSTVKTNKIWYRSDNVLFNISTLNSAEKRAQGLTLYYFDSAWNLTQLIRARAVQMKGSVWELKDGIVTLFAEESSFPLTKSFEKKIITMDEQIGDLQASPQSAHVMSLRQLRRFIAKNKSAGLETLNYEVDYHGKFGFAFAAFVMSLIGIPFSVKHQRSGGGVLNVGLCIGFAFGYWILYSSSLALGRNGLAPPWIAAWAPNLIMGSMAIFFLLRQKK